MDDVVKGMIIVNSKSGARTVRIVEDVNSERSKCKLVPVAYKYQQGPRAGWVPMEAIKQYWSVVGYTKEYVKGQMLACES